jgi:hypothetical protein
MVAPVQIKLLARNPSLKAIATLDVRIVVQYPLEQRPQFQPRIFEASAVADIVDWQIMPIARGIR